MNIKQNGQSLMQEMFSTQPRGIVRELQAAINMYEYPITGEIGDMEQYDEFVNMLRSAGEEDVFRITINSQGGDLFTAQALVEEIKRCNAFTYCSVFGECCSAATMIALACDDAEVNDNSSWLLHNAVHGSVGKANDIEDYVDHTREMFKRVAKQHYEHFLTEDEISQLLKGKQMYMFGDEVKDRMRMREEILESLETEQDPLCCGNEAGCDCEGNVEAPLPESEEVPKKKKK